MSDNILDEFDSVKTTSLPLDLRRARRIGMRCVGKSKSGKPCKRLGAIVRDNHCYCWSHDPGEPA